MQQRMQLFDAASSKLHGQSNKFTSDGPRNCAGFNFHFDYSLRFISEVFSLRFHNFTLNDFKILSMNFVIIGMASASLTVALETCRLHFHLRERRRFEQLVKLTS
jgi:hypothetical protein